MTISRYEVNVDEAVLTELQEKLSRVRWPDEPPMEPWSTGTSVDYLRDLVAYWRTEYDWRAEEARINQFDNFTVPIGAIDLHFIHHIGEGPDPMPLLPTGSLAQRGDRLSVDPGDKAANARLCLDRFTGRPGRLVGGRQVEVTGNARLPEMT